jgi:hypothetical protein
MGSLSDIWNTSNGYIWTRQVSNAPWNGRYDFGLVIYNNLIYLIGGQSANGGLNDVWVSSDCVNWTQLTNYTALNNNGHYDVISHNGRMFAIGGTNYGMNSLDSKQVYESVDGINWYQDSLPGIMNDGQIIYEMNGSLYIIETQNNKMVYEAIE